MPTAKVNDLATCGQPHRGDPSPRSGHNVRRIAFAITLIGLAATSACGRSSNSSFTSLSAAESQARQWVDATTRTVFPEGWERQQTGHGRRPCDPQDGDHFDSDYGTKVRVPVGDVDRLTTATWGQLRTVGFKLDASPNVSYVRQPDSPPSPDSRAFFINGQYDDFNAEIVGDRVDGTVELFINSPCLSPSS